METTYLKHATLLYVEDEEPIREFLKLRLARKVKKLYVAQNGKEGYELYKQYKPDLVLTDVTMPILNGIDMSKKIKEDDPNARIIIMSAHSDTSYLLEAIELGIHRYLLKPIDKNKLYETLESSISSKFLEEEVKEKRRQILHQSRFALLGEMTSMLAHQWRQPLNTISLSITKMQMDFEMKSIKNKISEEEKKIQTTVNSTLDGISTHVQDLSKTIDSFASIYRPSTEAIWACINETAKQALHNFKNSISYEDISIIEEFNATKKCSLYANEFIQICVNLLNNAFEHLTKREVSNPHILISTRDIKDAIQIEISDNAGGIDENIIDKIFDPYFSTKVEQNGYGLGLYMSKLVIEEHLHGKIRVLNEKHGAKFVIQLKEVE